MNKPLATEFLDFSREQIAFLLSKFKEFDKNKDDFIDFNELRKMMEMLGDAQTHLALKKLLRTVDEDGDGKLSKREFLLLFRLAVKGELECSDVLKTLAESVDKNEVGVRKAAIFFESKIDDSKASSSSDGRQRSRGHLQADVKGAEDRRGPEIEEEQEEEKDLEEEQRVRREKFQAMKSKFQ